MKKYKKKVTIVLGKLSIVLSILLGVIFGLPSSIYASVYQTGTSDHFSIQASQLATGREQVVLSWHNLYEGDYYDYVDLVQIKLKGANGTTYQLYLCLHGTDELAISFTNTDLTNMTVTTVQTWQFDNDNFSQLQNISLYLNQMAMDIDDMNYNIQTMTSTMNTLSSKLSDITDIENLIAYDLNIYQVNAYIYFKTVFDGVISTSPSYVTSAFTVEGVPPYVLYSRKKNLEYSQSYSLIVPANSKYILVVASSQAPLSSYTKYINPTWENSFASWRFRRTAPTYYLNSWSYDNRTSDYVYYQHEWDTLPGQGVKAYPLYYGPYDNCPYLNLLGLSTSSANDLEHENENLNETTSDLNTIETQFSTDFDTNINAIDLTSPTIINGSDFLNSANWVRTRFNEITVGNPFGSLIVFSMIIGLALLLIGRTL